VSFPEFTGECFIDGRWLRGSGPVFSSIAPADEAEIWTGNEAGAADVEAAVASARTAFPAWRRTPLDDRIAMVRRFAKLVEDRKADMAAVISRSVRRPRRRRLELSRLASAIIRMA
jgi:succinylglutamic semialdehyde dehydrogenase